MIQPHAKNQRPPQESASARPVASAEQWLGRNASEKRRLWERLNPPHRKQLQLLARALIFRQMQGRLDENLRSRLTLLLDEFEKLTKRIEQLLVERWAGKT